jgi:hypothetical protein
MVDNTVENNSVSSSNVEQSQQVVQESPGSDQSQQVSNISPAESVQEKMLSQSEVNELVGRVKRETAEKVRKETDSSANIGNFAMQQPQYSYPQQNQQNANPEMQQAAQQALHTLAQQMWANQTANQFVQKITEAEKSYPDIKEKIQDLNLVNNADLVAIANNVEKTADVMYELANNPVKYANVLTLMRNSPKQAEKALHEMSNAIKQNEEAKKQPLPDKPVSQLGHSTAGVGNGNSSDASIDAISRGSWLKKYV